MCEDGGGKSSLEMAFWEELIMMGHYIGCLVVDILTPAEEVKMVGEIILDWEGSGIIFSTFRTFRFLNVQQCNSWRGCQVFGAPILFSEKTLGSQRCY